MSLFVSVSFFMFLGCQINEYTRLLCSQEYLSFLTFPACFSIPIMFSNLNYNCSNLLTMRNLQEQVKKAFCYQKLFSPFTVWINWKLFANSRPSPLNFKSFSRSLKQFFLTVGQNNFGNKIPKLISGGKHTGNILK